MNDAIINHGYTNIIELACNGSTKIYTADRNNKKCVIKVIPTMAISDAINLAELELTLLITHPNIVKSRYVFTNKNYSLMFIEQDLAKTDLYKVLDTNSNISLKIKLKLIGDVGSGLHFLHVKNIAHCDIKPDNIFINDNALLGDFGLTTYIDSQIIAFQYMCYYSPEQLLDNDIKYYIKSEIWSYGILCLDILYETPYLLFQKFETRVALEVFMINYIKADDKYRYIIDTIGEVPDSHANILKSVIYNLLDVEPLNRNSIDIFLLYNKLNITNGYIDNIIDKNEIILSKDIDIATSTFKWLLEASNKLKLSNRAIFIMIELYKACWNKYNVGLEPSKIQLFGIVCLYLSALTTNYSIDYDEVLPTLINNKFSYKDINRHAIKLYLKERCIISRLELYNYICKHNILEKTLNYIKNNCLYYLSIPSKHFKEYICHQ